MDQPPAVSTTPKIVIFGSQILSLDDKYARQLRTAIVASKLSSSIHDVIAELPQLWGIVQKTVPRLGVINGGEVLTELGAWLRTGHLAKARFPLPNILLTPLVVLSHLVQYANFLDTVDGDEIAAFNSPTEALGLCTGMLSAAAAASSHSQHEFRTYAKVAIRLAVIIGAVVDVDIAAPSSGSDNGFQSFSVVWSSNHFESQGQPILDSFPGTYISVQQDQTRATVTAPKSHAAALLAQLKDAGFNVAAVGLEGRFHCKSHEDDARALDDVCDLLPEFQFPLASELAFPVRSNVSGELIQSGQLHKHILRSILVERSNWSAAFASLQQSTYVNTSEAQVYCFGPEACAPPSLSRKLGNRLRHFTTLGSSISASISSKSKASDLSRLQAEDGIAVVGMSCQLPGAEDLQDYWSILCEGVSQHEEAPTDRFSFKTPWRDNKGSQTFFGNFVKDYDSFDHKFFKKSPREMSSTDPQHRLMLQAAYQAVEQSGYFNRPAAFTDKHIGCYIGVGLVDYERNIACAPATAYAATGNLKSFAAGKISHHFGWTGPGLTIDTACSSSAVAIHTACRAILSGECTGGALAGGVNIMTGPEWFQNLAGASFLSPTGQCKPFDAKGDGYCRAEGVGAVFLKRLSTAIADGDQILGVVASSVVYQNQNCTAITVPNALSLSDLFKEAVSRAHLEPKHITYVEAHGTGTPVGDPAEYDGIRKQLGGFRRPKPLSLGSVKGLIGHTESASGIAALLKVLLMINMGGIPPQASFSTINPAIGATEEDCMDVSKFLKPWDEDFRAALINNYGASGSNACLVVTQGMKGPDPLNGTYGNAFTKHPFWFCAADERGMKAYINRFLKFLSSRSASGREHSLADLSYLLSHQSNRTLPQSLVFSCSSMQELRDRLMTATTESHVQSPAKTQGSKPVILCFGGQTCAYVGLDRDIYDNVTIFRENLDTCNAVCQTLGLDSLYPEIFDQSPIADIVKLQTMLFAAQYACAKTWLDCGLSVAAVVGFSFGELTALCVSGALSVHSAIAMISGRARLVQEKWGNDCGSMMAIEGDEQLVNQMLDEAATPEERASIACFTGPRHFTVAASSHVMEFVAETAKNVPKYASIRAKKIGVTHAFHSTLVDRLVPDLELLGEGVKFAEPTIPVERATAFAAGFDTLGPKFFAEHMRQPVCFTQAVERLAEKHGDCVWLEAGFNSGITSMASRTLGSLDNAAHFFQAFSYKRGNALQATADMTVGLWKQDVNVAFWPHHSSQRDQYSFVPLPPYQFERSRHWLEITTPPKETVATPTIAHRPSELWSFIGYNDSAQRSVAFSVNTTSDKFEQHVRGHVIAQTAPLCPSTFQMHIASEALLSLPSNSGLQPRLHDTVSHGPMPLEQSKHVLLEADVENGSSNVWRWKITGYTTLGVVSGSTRYVSGTIIFSSMEDEQAREEFARYARLVSSARCHQLLHDQDPDETVKGPKIYRRFAEIVDYGDMYKGLDKVVGKGQESAGRVSSTSSSNAWFHVGLADSFCQVAGFFVNSMSDRPPTDIYISDRIDRWTRCPSLGADHERPKVYEVLALHQQPTDKSFISDVFVFEPQSGKLLEAISGIRYQRVPKAALAKALSKFALATRSNAATVIVPTKPVEGKAINNGFGYQTPQQTPPESSPAPSETQQDSTPISGRVRDIISNLSGIEPEDIQDGSDLVELGIDSLMGMELAREIEIEFRIKLDMDELVDLTSFQSLVICVQKALGISDAPPVTQKPSNHAAIAQVNGFSGANGAASTNSASPSNGQGSVLQTSTIVDAFSECKALTDKFIVDYRMGNYSRGTLPGSTKLCVVHIIDAFESLGCPMRTAQAGASLDRIKHLPRHQQFVDWMYDLLERDAGLVQVDSAGRITRTSKPVTSKTAETLWEDLCRDSPDHLHDHNLTYHVGCKLAECLTGKLDGIQIIFGDPKGRDIVSNMYGKSPINIAWVKQMESFLHSLISRLQLPTGGEPLRMLEMGAGTGGTTSKILPLLANLGIPVKYTVTDLSSSLVAMARKRFKEYKFVEFKALDIEKEPSADFMQSQDIILATNCVHATHSLKTSTSNIRKLLRPGGFLMMLEMTTHLPWVDLTFGLVEGWWLFDDGRNHALAGPDVWDKTLQAAGYSHVDWTDGNLPEAEIQRIIIALESGPRYERAPIPQPPPNVSKQSADMERREGSINAYVKQYCQGLYGLGYEGNLDVSHSSRLEKGVGVLVTGATGSLGSHLVAHLASQPEVARVVCVNRRSANNDAKGRQMGSFSSKGILLGHNALAKMTVLETDTSKPLMGLSSEQYGEILHSVTHIVHNSWPMSITRSVEGFTAQFKVMHNLISLACQISSLRPKGFRVGFQFISSIATVGCYPLRGEGEVTMVPEERMAVSSVMPTGYGDAKLVCERMLEASLQSLDQFRPMAVRIAQIAGSTTSGYWNPVEHFAFIVKSSQTLKTLPDLKGDLSWCPVDTVAASLSGLLLADNDPHPVYHIENPSRQSWQDMIDVLARCLDVPRSNVVPFSEWLRRVREFAGPVDSLNPAARLVDFLDEHFITMSTGRLVLETKNSTAHAQVLKECAPVCENLVERYIEYWKRAGFLSK